MVYKLDKWTNTLKLKNLLILIFVKMLTFFLTASGSCLCPCQYVQVPKYTDVNDEKLIKEIKEVQKELQVLKNKTSAALRKKISIKDFRPSTNVSGAVWMVLLLFLVAAIVVPDAINAFQNIVHYFHRRKHNCNKRLKKWWHLPLFTWLINKCTHSKWCIYIAIVFTYNVGESIFYIELSCVINIASVFLYENKRFKNNTLILKCKQRALPDIELVIIS